MITIKINGNQQEIANGTTLHELIVRYVDAHQCFSIALNRSFIPRAQYQVVILNEYDEVDVIQPMQGG